jgi:hypothetical protein
LVCVKRKPTHNERITMSIEQIFSDGCREVAAAFHDLAAAIREQTAASAAKAGATVERIQSPAEKAIAEAKAKAAEAANDKKAKEEAAKVAAEMDAKAKKVEAEKAAASADSADVPDFQKVVYPLLLDFVNKKGKDAWVEMAKKFPNEEGVAPPKGKDVLPKHYAGLVAAIKDVLAADEV